MTRTTLMDNSLRLAKRPVTPICRTTGLPDFPAIRPMEVLESLEALVADYRSGVQEKLAAAGEPDWSFVDAEIEWSDAIDQAWSPLSHLNAVADTPEIRKAYNAGLKLLTEQRSRPNAA